MWRRPRGASKVRPRGTRLPRTSPNKCAKSKQDRSSEERRTPASKWHPKLPSAEASPSDRKVVRSCPRARRAAADPEPEDAAPMRMMSQGVVSGAKKKASIFDEHGIDARFAKPFSHSHAVVAPRQGFSVACVMASTNDGDRSESPGRNAFRPQRPRIATRGCGSGCK